ncbi:MAG TPA: sulfite exporter TauE/SafE family protein, partial [Thauera phenylacetica]|nr:sulfite exporter TauE/SafE family protein [Thauera phenylacetica]
AAAPGERPRALPFAWLCGAGAGFTSTLAHAGGPPIMAYLLSRGLPKERFVATSVFFFTAINLAKLPFYLGIGLFSRDTLLMSAMLLPLVPVGVWLGLHLLRRIPERPFFLFATWALALSGGKLLWDGLAG